MDSVHIDSHEITIGDESVTVYELRCPSGFTVQLMNWGASVLDIQMPDYRGQVESVVLGYADVNDYATNPPYLGATIGRVAGRIAEGRYRLGGEMQQLPPNSGAHVLHGGAHAMSHRLWEHETKVLSNGSACVTFRYVSAAGENGFSGNLTVLLRYTLAVNQILYLDYYATTDAPTLCNLTHHSYFNLAGNGRATIHAHQLQIGADAVCAMDDELLVTGGQWPVAGTDFDYRQMRPLGDLLESTDARIRQARGVDHYFILNPKQLGQPQVILYEPKSGRRLRTYTDQSCAVLYAHNYADGERLRGGRTGQAYDALCIETQACPHQMLDQGDHPARLLPDEAYEQRCVYFFDCLSLE